MSRKVFRNEQINHKISGIGNKKYIKNYITNMEK